MRRLCGLSGAARTFGAGEAVFRRGARVRSAYVVERGEIRLVRHPEVGRSMTLQVAREGALLAEASLFSVRYHCDAVATVPTTALAFPIGRLRRGLGAEPGAAAALAAHLAGEVQRLRAQAALLGIRSARERLLAYLDTLSDVTDGWIDPGHPWTMVASEIGLSHEAVYRALADLEQAGHIERDGRAVRVLG